jgi:hypothetical protein
MPSIANIAARRSLEFISDKSDVIVSCTGVGKSKSKGKVAPVLLTEHHAMEAYWRLEV